MGRNGAQSRDLNPNWKGGRTIGTNGYVRVRVADHRGAGVRGYYIYEHRLVAEQKIGRRLRKGERVHHRDHDKTNNAPSNLEVVTDAEHGLRHRRGGATTQIPGEPNPAVGCACGCGATIDRYDGRGRPRRFVSGHNMKRGAA